MLNSLQMLRGFAAYAVVVFHTLGFLSLQPAFGIPRVRKGMPGVELFFILSGFIMVHTVRADETPLRFFMKRLFRIVPIYWVATLIVIIAALNIDWIFADANLAPESILASLAFIPMPNNFGDYMPILYVGWTLNFEILFYAVFSIGLFLPRRYLVPYIVVAMSAIGLTAYLMGDDGISGFYGHLIILNFCTGALLAVLFNRKGFATKLSRWGPILILCIAAIEFVYFLIFPLPGEWGALASLVILNSVVFALLAMDAQNRLKESRIVTALGASSYSAYLLHPFIIPLVGVAVMRYVGTSAVAALVMFVGVFIITVIVSTISFLTIEQRSNTFLRKVFLPKRT